MSAPNDDLGAVIDALKQDRRDLAHRIAAELAASPEWALPNMGAISMLAATEGAIAAVEAIIAADADDGGETA